MAVQSLDQERAAFAWKKVKESKKDGDFKAYTSLAKGAPALIMGNGLMQTLAFLKQKGGEAAKLENAISEWIKERFDKEIDAPGFDGVMTALYQGSSSFYMQATEETLEILRWIRQFAPALGKD